MVVFDANSRGAAGRKIQKNLRKMRNGRPVTCAYAVGATQATAAHLAAVRMPFAALCWISEDRAGVGMVPDLHPPRKF